MSTKELGNLGEKIACEYLVKNGYKIIDKNYRINFGEIDIIARKKRGLLDLFRKNPSARASTELSRMSSGQAIHFVEVKTLRRAQGKPFGGNNFYPEEHVDWRKQQKYKRLAEIWLQKNKYPQDIPYQIDIIAVSMDGINSKAEGPDEGRIDFFENVLEG